MEPDTQTRLIEALHNPDCFPHPCTDFQLIQTHISWVILCGPYAYKIKKAVNLGFLDFSTLERRRHFCEEELRLNRRLAPHLYLQVVHFSGSPDTPQLDGPGKPFEYAVKMARFSQQDLLARMAREHRLQALHIDHMIEQIAAFHKRIPAAAAESGYGTPEAVARPVEENFAQIRERTGDPAQLRLLETVEQWSREEQQRRNPVFAERREHGFVRECHGDMHLGNMAWVEQELLIFDGIEFNPSLYWIDVMSETAFLCMDLEDRGYAPFAFRFLNGYLERTGDYAGLAVCRYYLVYRAMVRAKVASIRMQQEAATERDQEADELRGYLNLALSYIRWRRPLLLITHGLSASGKSTLSAPLAERLPAIRIRSDRERQRLFGSSGEDAAGAIEGGIYTPKATEQTYGRLLRLTEAILQAGFSVIVDATFLKAEQRAPFRRLAARLRSPFRILHFDAPHEVLRRRIRQRQAAGADISEADLQVLEHQIQNYQNLLADETDVTVRVDTEALTDAVAVQELLKRNLRGRRE
jgi:aminoglycoside phosphotransferase family enzyme/predicted kinase